MNGRCGQKYIRKRFSLQVFVAFERHTSCVNAFRMMCERTYKDRSVIATYFPPDDFNSGNFY